MPATRWPTASELRRDAVLAALYLTGAVVASLYLRTPQDVTVFWPSAGLALAAVLRYGLRTVVIVPIAMLALHLLYLPVSPLFLTYSVLSNTLATLLAGAYVLKRQRHFTLRLRDGLLMLRGGVLLALVDGAIGTLGLVHAGMIERDAAGSAFALWVLGDLLGITAIGPLCLIVLGNPGDRARIGSRGWQGGEGSLQERLAWLAMLAASLVLLVVMGRHGSMYSLALLSLPLALLMWAAVRYPAAITMLATAGLTVMLSLTTGLGLWGFPRPASKEDAALLILLLVVISLVPIILQAANHERRMVVRALRERATHDALTGLLNRAAFEQAARAELVFGSGARSLVYVDLDHFKLANDVASHAAGDELLRRVGALVREAAGPQGLASRLGGDEFGLLLAMPESQAQVAVRRLLADIDALRVVWEGQSLIVSASAGLTATHAPNPAFDTLLSRADAACTLAKEQGGSRLRVATGAADAAQVTDPMRSTLLVREAIEQRRLSLHCQPIVPLQPDAAEALHFEVLLRHHDAQDPLGSAADLVMAAERYRLGPRLDRHVLDMILRWLREHEHAMPADWLCSINVGATSVVDEEFSDYLAARLARKGVAPEHLCLEITETHVVRDFSRARRFIERIRALGCRFALDDFGTGFCSFAYLRELDVDYLKIDGSFVCELGSTPLAEEVVRSITGIGHVLGMKTVAEHVETEEQVRRLRALGVDLGQGYAFGRPMPVESFFAALRTSSSKAAAVTAAPAPGPWTSNGRSR